jgi:acetate kinase
LEHGSGLLGLFGASGDIRDVEAGVARGDEAARLAYDVYLHRLRASVGAMVASLGGLDAIVFTGGVGEHSAQVRADTCAGLAHLGVRVDEVANSAAVPDADVSGAGSAAATLVVASREDRQIAVETRRTLASTAP